jgi:ribosome biogenesis ATPase
MKRSSLESGLEKRVSSLIVKYQHSAAHDNAWNLEDIYNYIIHADQSFKRKPARNVKRAIESAIDSLRKDESDSSLDSNPLEQINDNSLNASLLNVYSKKENIKAATDGKDEPKLKKLKREQKWSVPTSKLSDLGGIDTIIQEILQLIGMPLKHPQVYSYLGVQPPRGILLHGPPGVGKTVLANAIAGEFLIPLINISAPSIVSGMSGESEKKIREVFEDAKTAAPCILFIDEIDAITPKRETAQREMERRIVSQLLTCMDDLSLNSEPVIIIGATNRPDSLDPALRRAGRFDREISMGVPDEKSRAR